MIVDAARESDRWLFLIGGVAAIVGSLIGMVGNLIHPSRALTIIGPSIITLWLLAMGILLVRKSQRLGETTSAERLAIAAESVS